VDTGGILYENVTTPRSAVEGQMTASLVQKEREHNECCCKILGPGSSRVGRRRQ